MKFFHINKIVEESMRIVDNLEKID